ncbi:hypothetical protein D3C74_398800 [compost metagenome]
MSRWIVRKELASGEIVELRIRQKLPERDFLIIRRKGNSAAMAIRVFIEKLLTAQKA